MSASIRDQISCVEREIRLRERVYPKQINAQKMTAVKAQFELATMRAVLATLKDVALRVPIIDAPTQDCPHAAPYRYCEKCVVDPCPVGLGRGKP